MKIERENLEDRQIQLTVELDDDRLVRAMRSAAKRLGKNSKIAGFRPGKAPYEVLLRRFGEDTIFDEALENLGQELYREALEKSEIDAFAPGMLEKVISREPLTLRYTVPLAPEVDLGAYKELRLSYEEPEIEDEAVDRVMKNLRERQALIEHVERSAALGDVIVTDIKAEILDENDDKDQILLDNKDVSILVDEETNWPIPGISNFLVGLKAGDEKNFEYTFPEDYVNERMRGKSATFEISCLEVKSRFIPQWTDDLAKTIGDYESLLDLRMSVRNDLTNEAIRQAETKHGREIVDKVVEGATVTYPPILLQQEMNDMLKELEDRLRMQKLSIDDYLKVENKTEEELIEELRPKAEERLKRALVLGELVSAENIEVNDADIEAEIDRIMEHFKDRSDQTRKLFDNPESRHRIALDLLSDKAIKRLIAIAAGEVEKQNEPELAAEDGSEIAHETLEVKPELDEETSEELPEANEATTEPVSEMEKKAPESAPKTTEE
ncbi:MAG: trigger factor [Chloroflexi bacterium RBG_16_48_8]|nr:MAG: trigger factor [Chloroflexi bacterium RBG_16_48_8]